MSKNLCTNNYNALTFVKTHYQSAVPIAKLLNVPVENILGLAAHESQYGQGHIAVTYNNYFSMWAPAPLQTEAEPAGNNPHVKVAKFDSFIASGQSFAMRFGAYVRGESDPIAFGKALIRARYNFGSSRNGGTDGYAQKLAQTIDAVKIRMECQAK